MTDFERPLNKAIELIKGDKFRKADIIFITDGECSVSEQFLKKFEETKEDKEFSCMGILLNIGSGGVSDSSMKSFCDEVVTVSNLADLTNEDSDIAHKIFNKV